MLNGVASNNRLQESDGDSNANSTNEREDEQSKPSERFNPSIAVNQISLSHGLFARGNCE